MSVDTAHLSSGKTTVPSSDRGPQRMASGKAIGTGGAGDPEHLPSKSDIPQPHEVL